MKWYYFLICFFSLVIVLRFINNLYKYLRIKKLYNKYCDYLIKDNCTILQDKEEIKSLFLEAGLQDLVVLHQEFLGFGHYANMKLSVYENLANNREDIVGNVMKRFNEAIGVFRKRFRDSYNPMFWIDVIVKLPQYIMQFFGVLPEKIVVKILLVIYWLFAILSGLKEFDILEQLIK